MTPYEIMLSESQERMLLVVKQGREAEVEAIFEKWDLHAVHIGDGHRRRPAARDASAARSSPTSRTGRSPTRRRSTTGRCASPTGCDEVAAARPGVARAARARRRARCCTLLASPTIASKRWIYRQYDHMVRTNTMVLPGLGDAASCA